MGPIKIIDSHHHIWDRQLNRYPWLDGPSTTAHFGSTDQLPHEYPIGAYLKDIAGHNIVKSVHVEAGADPSDPVNETRRLQGIAETHGYPHGIVAYANLADPKVRDVLEAHCESPNMRGIRMMTKKVGQLSKDVNASGSLMSDAQWREGFAVLGEMGLSFDLQAPAPLMAEAAALAAVFPDNQLMLTHAGLPLDRTEDGMAAWRAGMRQMAEQANMALKVSGIPMTDWIWTVDSLRPMVLDAIDAFGVHRTMFGSNFPIDRLYSDYGTLFEAYRTIVADFSPEEQAQMFHGNAARLYRL